MEHRKTILGLKAAPPQLINDESEDDDSIFNDNDGDLLQLPLQTSQPRLPIVDSPDENQQNTVLNRIKSFDEILPRISQIMNAFEDQTSLPTQYTGDIYFIPEHIVNDEYSQELNDFIQSTDPDAEYHFPEQDDIAEIHPNILAQIDIVKYTKKQKVDLMKYTKDALDSRILSLIYFILSKQDDKEISCFYCAQTLLEIIKTFEFAPISSLLQDYTIQYIFHQLSIDLVTLFPHHPLLESILHKFSSYDPAALDTLALLPNDTDESDSFDDDFFADIQAVQCQKPTIKLNDIFNDSSIINPLDNNQPATQNMVTVTILDPPSTLTYQFFDESTQLSPTAFTNWINSLNVQGQIYSKIENVSYEIPASSDNVSGSVPKQETYLSATTPTVSFNLPIKIESSQDVDKKLLINLIQYIDQPNTLLSYLSYFPNSLDLQLFPYLFPILQSVNTTSVTPLKKGCLYPKLIVHEFDACQTLINNKHDKIVEVLKDMAKKVPSNSIRSEIKPLDKKRHFPTTETLCPENIVEIISLSDIEMVLNGRSPLTFERVFRDQILNPPFERDWRAEVLYHYYTVQELPPYICFRVAFALALNLSEMQPDRTQLAIDILFEGLYGLLNALPKMASSYCVHNSLLLFGEMLDRLDRYYYSALLLDAYFLGNASYQTSSQISPICQHRGDMVRSVFHFNQTMNFFIQTNRCDEALYVSQVISSIYDDFGLYYNSISLLTYLLRKTYKLSVGRSIQKVSIKKTKTMPPVRQFPASNKIVFAPSPSGTNTLLSGISLATLLVKFRYFKLSKELLEALKKSSNSRVYLRLIEFVTSKRLLKKNKFINFLNSLPQLTIRQKRSSAGSRLTSLSASTFDTVIALIKMLMTGFLNRNLLGQSIFWSEVILNTQTKFNLKDIGGAFLIRGECFLRYKWQSNVTNGLLTVHVPLNQVMTNVGEYRDNHIFKNQTEITQEAVASLKAARICFEKVGCQMKMLLSSILYTSVILQHFIDELGYLNEEPLEIKTPRLETKSKSGSNQQVVTFEPYKITLQNLEEHLSMLCQSIETMTSRLMNPLLIIFSEIVVSKFNLFQKKLTSSKKRFEYAYTNFKKLFSCGGYVIIQDLSLNFVRIVHLILQYMCQMLLLFDQEFINNHLIAFDWFNDCDTLYQKKLRVFRTENNEPIDASINVSLYALKSMVNYQFPDFFPTLDSSQAEISKDPPIYKETLQSYILRINANIKLHELQKLSQSQLHENNRSLCLLIENLADSYRHEHPHLIPPETDYNFAIRPPSIASQAVLVQLLFDGIYVYVPSTGEKRFCPLIPPSSSTSSQYRSHAFSYPKSESIPQLVSDNSNSNNNVNDSSELNSDEVLDNPNETQMPNEFKNDNININDCEDNDQIARISPSSKAESAPASMSPLDKLSVFENYSDNKIDPNDQSILLGEPFSDDDSQLKKKEKVTNSTKSKADEIVDDEANQKQLQKDLNDFISKYFVSFTLSPKKMQDQTFTSSSGLFPSPLFEYIACLIMPDKSNKKFVSTNISQRTKLKFAQRLRKQLFDDILLEKSINADEWVKKPDKQVFYNIKASTNKGALETVHKAPRPIVLVVSNSLKAVPFELLFPTQLVLRCWNYSQLILPGKSSASPSSPTAGTSLNPIPNPSHNLNNNNNNNNNNHESILAQNINSDMDSDSFELRVPQSFSTISTSKLHKPKTRKSASNFEFNSPGLNLDIQSPSTDNSNINFDASASNLENQTINTENSKQAQKHRKSNADSPTPLLRNKKPVSEFESVIAETDSKMALKHTPVMSKKKKIPLPKDDPKISSTPKPSRSSSLVVVSAQMTPLSFNYQFGVSPIIIRKRGDFETSTMRSIDLLRSIIISCGGAFRTAPEFVPKYERDYIYMCPAFLSGKDTNYYQQKYPFCTIYEHESITDELNVASTLFLLSYADLAENHDTLRKLSMDYPSSFFMFIPGQVFKESLKTMKLIFERQKKRKAFTLGKKDDIHLADHVRLSKVPFEFITSLQLTLSNAMNCPIPLIGLP